MTTILVLTSVSLTSLGAFMLGRRARLDGRRLWRAFKNVMEGIGLGLVFFALNALAAATFILTARRFTAQFISIYDVNDLSLLVLSILQGLLFRSWPQALAESD